MCGGYSEFLRQYQTDLTVLVNRDDFISRYRMVTLGREAVLKQVARG
jgi:hypothetical protein